MTSDRQSNGAHFHASLFNFAGTQLGPVESPETGGVGVVFVTPEGRVTLDCFHSDTSGRDVIELLIEPEGEKPRRMTHAITSGRAPLDNERTTRIKLQAQEAF